MRLCLIANPNSIHIRRWVCYFANRGHEVHLVGTNPPAAAWRSNAVLHDLTRTTNRPKLRFVVWSILLRRLVRTLQPDVLHAHQVSGAGRLGAATGYHPFMVTCWGSDLLVSAHRSPLQRRRARLVLRRADYIACVSEPLAQVALELGADPQRLEVAYWGVDTETFHAHATPSAPVLHTGEADSSPTPLTVLSIRSLRPLYNPLTIAQAIPLVLAQVPQARFIIRTYSFDSGLLAAFQSAVEAAGASDAVDYVGDLPDDQAIADLYRQSTVAVSVPSSDGTPQSVLEAMACGAVPVVSDLPSLRKWVVHEREALLVPPANADALAYAINRLLSDPELRQRMRTAAQELIAQRADSAVWMARNEEIYRKLAGILAAQPVR